MTTVDTMKRPKRTQPMKSVQRHPGGQIEEESKPKTKGSHFAFGQAKPPQQRTKEREERNPKPQHNIFRFVDENSNQTTTKQNLQTLPPHKFPKLG